ncbi:MAG: DJ-1/PfpI family protein [Chitinophaga sp.]|uniref:GlxA family transcriptional regulator n=1 Tax=Chitinophaga sp. TaxID=1869181 RepID=UPI0025C2B871|nr:DJ-1/PfpI family protein [Chitinophaga sp.]MBV8252086.1 DJ-1/PfpI family protein [Chitinophaga sp.]
MKRKIAFLLLPQVELLDLAGPVQVFSEAQYQGLDIEIVFCSFQQSTMSAPGLTLSGAIPYTDLQLTQNDFLFIPGIRAEVMERDAAAEVDLFHWLRQQAAAGVALCTVCNAAFILGEAGLLDGKECTTHWRSVGLLQQLFPTAKVRADVLFVKSENIYTSAGISSGIDLALFILEGLKDAYFTHKVARGLVLYHRRNPGHSQESIYLSYRNHMRPEIHQVQDYLIENLSGDCSIDTLAAMAAMSPRHLNRVFREQTGITLHQYINSLRVEKATSLLHNPAYTMEYIAAQCGLKSARQLQRILP